MPKETNEDKQYPVKSLHDFLFELDKEWTKFRNGTLIGLASSGILFIVVVWLTVKNQAFRAWIRRFCAFNHCRRLLRLQHLRNVLAVSFLQQVGTPNRLASAYGRANDVGKTRRNQGLMYIFGAHQKCGFLFKDKNKEANHGSKLEVKKEMVTLSRKNKIAIAAIIAIAIVLMITVPYVSAQTMQTTLFQT